MDSVPSPQSTCHTLAICMDTEGAFDKEINTSKHSDTIEEILFTSSATLFISCFYCNFISTY